MKLKGVRALRRTDNGIFALTGEVEKVSGSIYGDLHSLPVELVDLPKEEGYYTVDGDRIDIESWVDPVDWLPKGMLYEWKYAAMDRSKDWYFYRVLPAVDEDPQVFSVSGNGNYYTVDQLFITYPDPLGWRQSLHVRGEDGNWKRF